MIERHEFAFYAEQSSISDPGRYVLVLDCLPHDISALARVISGIIMHPAATGLYGEPPIPMDEAWGICSVADSL